MEGGASVTAPIGSGSVVMPFAASSCACTCTIAPCATAAPPRPDNATSCGSPAKFTKKYEKKIKIQLQVLEIPGGRSFMAEE